MAWDIAISSLIPKRRRVIITEIAKCFTRMYAAPNTGEDIHVDLDEGTCLRGVVGMYFPSGKFRNGFKSRVDGTEWGPLRPQSYFAHWGSIWIVLPHRILLQHRMPLREMAFTIGHELGHLLDNVRGNESGCKLMSRGSCAYADRIAETLVKAWRIGTGIHQRNETKRPVTELEQVQNSVKSEEGDEQ